MSLSRAERRARRTPAGTARPAFGLDDLEYQQRAPEKGLITKQEARAVSLAKLALAADAVVWDIGAGPGRSASKRRDWRRLGHVWAIEKNAADAANARANAALSRRQLHPGRGQGAGRPRHLARPRRRLHRRLGRRTRRADPPDPGPPEAGGRLVMNFVTLENLATATSAVLANAAPPGTSCSSRPAAASRFSTCTGWRRRTRCGSSPPPTKTDDRR
jgi:precorrin-6Y C5,15-methyltransferase (decarboxylating)